ncbi:MAG: [Fe-Fe] hydrogenase large subunit C-terminal domain-containing protein [Fervidobacterium sp.]
MVNESKVNSLKMTPSRYILSNEANCKYCYKCLRNCPVKAISFHDNYSYVIEEECILCGTCVKTCPQHSKNYKSELEHLKNIIGKPFVVSLAPSFFGNMENPFKILGFLRTMGAIFISETAVGAEFVTNEYIGFFSNTEGPVITTSCPVIVKLVEIYFPRLVNYLFPFVSPAIAHAKFLSHLFGSIPKVFIGPCIAKKEELEKDYDIILTFEELSYFLSERAIDISQYQDRYPDAPYPDRGRMYPVSGGIIFSTNHEPYQHLILEGTRNIMDFFEKFSLDTTDKIIIEASACVGSCLNGPASNNSLNLLQKKQKLKLALQTIESQKNADKKSVKILGSQNVTLNLNKSFSNKSRNFEILEKDIEKILLSMGKDTKEKELDCTGCGYETCRDKAKAVYLNKAEKEMCFAYLVEKVSSVSNKVVDESPNAIIIFKDKEILYVNPSARKLFQNYENEKIVEICEKIHKDGERLHELYINGRTMYFYPKAFSLPDESGKVLLLVDLTELILQKEQMNEIKRRTIEKIEEVLNNQMKLAQDIASILGESIAETKSHFLEFKKYMGEDHADL